MGNSLRFYWDFTEFGITIIYLLQNGKKPSQSIIKIWFKRNKVILLNLIQNYKHPTNGFRIKILVIFLLLGCKQNCTTLNEISSSLLSYKGDQILKKDLTTLFWKYFFYIETTFGSIIVQHFRIIWNNFS